MFVHKKVRVPVLRLRSTFTFKSIRLLTYVDADKPWLWFLRAILFPYTNTILSVANLILTDYYSFSDYRYCGLGIAAMQFFSKIVDWLTTPYTIYLILKDPTASLPEKLRAVIGLVIILAYIISPIDIIPDSIPFSGWLDDLLIIPIGMALIRIITPAINIMEKRKRAQASVKRILLLATISIAVTVILGLFLLGLLICTVVRLIPLKWHPTQGNAQLESLIKKRQIIIKVVIANI